jgi:hypothetical protein
LPPAAYIDTYDFGYVRGFVERATISLACLPHLDALFAIAPLIRHLRITPGQINELGSRLGQPKLGTALASRWFARLHTLELTLPGGGNELAAAVAVADTLRELRTLRIAASVWGEALNYYDVPPDRLALDDAGVVTLSRAQTLAKLEVLDLDSNRMTSAGVTAIAAGPWKLRELVLSHNLIELGSRHREAIAAFAAPALANLEVLGLASTGMKPRDVGALFAGPHLPKLRELDLERSQIGALGAVAMCKAFALPALRRLRLERNSLCDAGAVAIAGCARLANLTSLEAGHNLMGRTGGLAIASSPHLANLERLTLNEPRWKPEMKEAFAASPTLAKAKIYLGGRLVGRGKKSGVTAQAPAAKPKAAKKKPKKR